MPPLTSRAVMPPTGGLLRYKSNRRSVMAEEMGCFYSTPSPTDEQVGEWFAEFLEQHCVRGYDRSVSWSELECAFSYFLAKQKREDVDLRVVSSHLDRLCGVYEFERTNGYRIWVNDSNVSTRYVLGVTVVRFRPKLL